MSRMSTAPTPRNYTEADAVLNGGRNSDSRKIANNTWLERIGDAIAVRLHATDVAVFYPDGTVVFRTGGWNTSTTRARLNAYAPAGIAFFSRKRDLYYVVNGDHDHPVLATEGMRFDPQTSRVTPGRVKCLSAS